MITFTIERVEPQNLKDKPGIRCQLAPLGDSPGEWEFVRELAEQLKHPNSEIRRQLLQRLAERGIAPSE